MNPTEISGVSYPRRLPADEVLAFSNRGGERLLAQHRLALREASPHVFGVDSVVGGNQYCVHERRSYEFLGGAEATGARFGGNCARTVLYGVGYGSHVCSRDAALQGPGVVGPHDACSDDADPHRHGAATAAGARPARTSTAPLAASLTVCAMP
jgi:hypothetical protein